MAMFPDNFPFNRRDDDAPVVEATPLNPVDAFADDFPFTKREEQPAPAAAAATMHAGASRIFPPGFPFAESQQEVMSVVDASPRALEPIAVIADAPHEHNCDAPVQAALIVAGPSLVPPKTPHAAPAPLPFKDRRRSPRQHMNAKATLRVDTVGGNPLRVEIDNLSLLGVRFRADRELLVNDKANLRLEVGPLKWASRLRVINCADNGDESYTIGCEFVGNELARGRIAA